MPRYEADHFEPPAPVARVNLRASDQTDTVTGVPMLLDTGADVNMVPRAAVKKLALKDYGESFKLVGFDGSSSQATSVHLELVFCGRSFNGAFLLIDQEWGILGRNVLNRIPILYDGPRLAWAAQGVKESCSFDSPRLQRDRRRDRGAGLRRGLQGLYGWARRRAGSNP